MIKNILTTLVLGACAISAVGQGDAVYQLPNSDFESTFVQAYYKKIGLSTTRYYEPPYWHGYATLEGSVAGFGRTGDKLVQVTSDRGNGGNCVCIKATNPIGSTIANGVMTTGRISANATSPTDNNNYNFSRPNNSNSSNSNKNPNFYQPFNGKPDYMKVWVKFEAAEATQKSDYKYAAVNAVIHDESEYRDPEKTDVDYSEHKVAQAQDDKIAKYGEWQQLEIAFNYDKDKFKSDDPQYILVTFTTNARPGGGTNGDKLYIDDIEMVYNYDLTSFKYNGKAYSISNNTPIRVDGIYNSENVELESNGHGATFEKVYDVATGLLTVNVKANDYAESGNMNSYLFQFDKPASVSTYEDDLTVTVDGESNPAQKATINVAKMPNGTYYMQLKDFKLNNMPIGTIVLENMQGQNGSMTEISTKQTIVITNGTNAETEWLGPSLGLVPVVFSGKMAGNKFYCNIDIDMKESLEQTINVVFGKKIVPVTETAAVSAADAGDAHVVLDRAFNAGWNTVCLPFAYTASEIAEGAEAQEFKADHGSWLTFDAVEGQLEPNKPYLINVPTTVAAGKVFENKTIVAGTPASVSNGNFTFTGVYEQKDMNGSYGVATVDGKTMIFQGGTNSKIMGTRAYFECSDKSISSVSIAFNGETTSISTITAPAAAAATGVYNLQGIKLNNTGSTAGLPAGLYIVNGQKVLVK